MTVSDTETASRAAGRFTSQLPNEIFQHCNKNYFLLGFFVVFFIFSPFLSSKVSIRKNRRELVWRTSVHRWFQKNSVKKSRTSGGGGGEDVSDTLLSPPSEASSQQGRSQTSDAAAAAAAAALCTFLYFCFVFLLIFFFLCAGKQRL